MSSGDRDRLRVVGAAGFEVGDHRVEDDVGESALEDPYRFLAAVAVLGSPLDEGLGVWIVARLGESDAVEGCRSPASSRVCVGCSSAPVWAA